MNKEALETIKQKAIQEHIPIIMDETLETIKKYMKDNRHSSRIFRNMFYRATYRNGKNRYNRKRNRESNRSKAKYKKSRSRKNDKHL